ncbi:MAG: restriction endonuclease subunit S [Endomicrobiaceae bacterium]|nr:restriction endonuclease subunit S [Endomicrobiaceae bacterium]
MAQISCIKYTDLLKYSFGYILFSPTYFQNNKLQFWNLLEKQSNKTVADCFNIVTEVVNNINQNIICYDLSHAITKFLLDGNEIDKIGSSKKVAQDNDFIISRLRSYLGQMCIVQENKKQQLFSTEFLIFRSKNKEISTHTLFIFCMTKFVQTILQMSQYGTEHPRFYDFILEKLPLPKALFDIDDAISKFVKSAQQKQTQSKQLYSEAEELLLRELGLLNYQTKHILTFSTTKKEIDEAHRYDSEYFQPKYAEIIKKIEKYENGWDFAGKIVNWKKGFEVGTEAYAEIGKEFIRVSDFSVYGIAESNKKISKQTFDELKKDYQPKQGEILFTKDGTIGISYVLKETIEGILSGAFLRLTLKEKYQKFEKECLSLIFNSILCKMQVEKLSGGAVIDHLKPSDFETFKIPLIRKSIQKQIAERLEESHKLKEESKRLLEEAKRKVEEEIEKQS